MTEIHLSLIGIVVSAAALLYGAAVSFRATKETRQIAESVQKTAEQIATKPLGTFPEFMPQILDLVSKAEYINPATN